MDALIFIIQAKKSAQTFNASNHQDRLAFQVGYLERTIVEICNLFNQAEDIMYLQKELIEQMKKANSASL